MTKATSSRRRTRRRHVREKATIDHLVRAVYSKGDERGTMHPAMTASGLMSQRSYADFHLRVETTFSEGPNSCIQFRTSQAGFYGVHVAGTSDPTDRHTGDRGGSAGRARQLRDLEALGAQLTRPGRVHRG